MFNTGWSPKLTVPSPVDAIKSYDDLVKSGLPVRAHIHGYLAEDFKTLPLFQGIRNRTTFRFGGKPDEDRLDIAYLVEKRRGDLYVSVSYRLLPEIVHTVYVMPVLMTKYSPYERSFEIAFMRAVDAGALETKRAK